ncbi:MAG: ribosome-binding factor A [Patescibacteria group bacterium]|jgi:ribosome-binding factor A
MAKRGSRAGEILRQKLSLIIAREVELPGNSLVTIVKAETTANLKSAKIWITITPAENIGLVYGRLRDQTGELQKSLADELDWQFTPKLSFRIDRGSQAAEAVEEILRQIHEE